MNKDIKVTELSNKYEPNFNPSDAYLDSMPDLQNSEFDSDIKIERVGIHDFCIPLKVMQKYGGFQEVKASITGMVSLEADKAGINMSRILRTVYKVGDSDGSILSVDNLCRILEQYKKDLDTFEAHIIMKFPYRMWVKSLVSRKDNGEMNGGWQYYDVVFDISLDKSGAFNKTMWVDFVYSSACPCSTALSKHAALERGLYGIPHSQRSIAKVGIRFHKTIWIEDIIELLRDALTTETLVFCKREDEQDFALKNGADPKFVEDAIRRIALALEGGLDISTETVRDFDPLDVIDYKIICSHLESLHSHDAIAVKVMGVNGGFKPEVSWAELQSMKI